MHVILITLLLLMIFTKILGVVTWYITNKVTKHGIIIIIIIIVVIIITYSYKTSIMFL